MINHYIEKSKKNCQGIGPKQIHMPIVVTMFVASQFSISKIATFTSFSIMTKARGPKLTLPMISWAGSLEIDALDVSYALQGTSHAG